MDYFISFHTFHLHSSGGFHFIIEGFQLLFTKNIDLEIVCPPPPPTPPCMVKKYNSPLNASVLTFLLYKCWNKKKFYAMMDKSMTSIGFKKKLKNFVFVCFFKSFRCYVAILIDPSLQTSYKRRKLLQNSTTITIKENWSITHFIKITSLNILVFFIRTLTVRESSKL